MKPILLVVHLGSPARTRRRQADHSRLRAPEGVVPEPANQPFRVLPLRPRVTATELHCAFDENAADAERRFGAGAITVAGAVERVAPGPEGYSLDLSVSGRGDETVRCACDVSAAEELAGLRRGDLVLVLGRRVAYRDGLVVVEEAAIIDGDVAGVGRGRP